MVHCRDGFLEGYGFHGDFGGPWTRSGVSNRESLVNRVNRGGEVVVFLGRPAYTFQGAGPIVVSRRYKAPSAYQGPWEAGVIARLT